MGFSSSRFFCTDPPGSSATISYGGRGNHHRSDLGRYSLSLRPTGDDDERCTKLRPRKDALRVVSVNTATYPSRRLLDHCRVAYRRDQRRRLRCLRVGTASRGDAIADVSADGDNEVTTDTPGGSRTHHHSSRHQRRLGRTLVPARVLPSRVGSHAASPASSRAQRTANTPGKQSPVMEDDRQPDSRNHEFKAWILGDEALALIGRLDEGITVFNRLLGYAYGVGLFSEDIEPGTGRLLGSFPQAYTHVGLVHAAITIGDCSRRVTNGSERGRDPIGALDRWGGHSAFRQHQLRWNVQASSTRKSRTSTCSCQGTTPNDGEDRPASRAGSSQPFATAPGTLPSCPRARGRGRVTRRIGLPSRINGPGKHQRIQQAAGEANWANVIKLRGAWPARPHRAQARQACRQG